MKVLFVLPNLAVGGIERVRLALIEYFAGQGIECRLALRRCRGDWVGRAKSLVPIAELAPDGMHQFVPALVRLIRQEQPTHVITAFPDVAVLTWIALRAARSKAKWVHSVDSTHSAVGSRTGAWGRFRFRLENSAAGFAYRRADAVVAVSQGLRREILDRFDNDPSRVTVIYNPVVPDEQLRWQRVASRDRSGPCRIVAMGRLVRAKGFDVLIKAMAHVPGSWHLVIWGEGAERSALSSLIDGLGLHDTVRLGGYTPDPFGELRRADIYVMASRHEGLGNTLIEALACQCQIVAADCPHGPREVLQDGELGQLVPVDATEALAGAIARAIDGRVHVDPKRLLDRAASFSCADSSRRWESLLRSL